MKPVWIVAVIIVACLASTAYAENVSQTLDFSKNGRLEVSNVAGSVTVRGWNRDSIQVEAEIESEYDSLEFKVNDRDAYIGVTSSRDDKRRTRRHRHHGQNDDVEMVIRVPRSTRVSVNTVSADIDIEGIDGKQRLESVSGDITTSVRSKEATAHTVSGEIELNANNKLERLSVHSVSGDLELTGVSGELRLETVSGDADVEASTLTRVDARTVSGDLTIIGELKPGGEIDMESVNGDLDLQLASLHNTEFDLESFNGSIDPIFGYRAVRTSRYAPGRQLRLIEGDGDSRIRIKTLNGDLELVATREGGKTPVITHTSARAPGAGADDDDRYHYHDDDDHDHEND